MTAELTPYQQQPANGMVAYQQPPPANGTVQSLQVWAESARVAHAVAESLATTSFVPQQFRNKPDEVTAAILAGDEVGLSPLAALRSFDIIQGTAAARAITLRAILQSRGHEIWTVESTDARAIVRGKRLGSDQVHESIWDTGRARGLGLLGKDNWKKQPKAMLVARATAECCRLVAADAILGIPYAVEELDDGQDEKPAARRTAQRATATVQREPKRPAPNAAPPAARPPRQERPAPAAGPPLPGEDDYEAQDTPAAEAVTTEPDEPPAGDPITGPQSRAIGAIMRKADIADDRTARMQLLSHIVDRRVESSKDLTKDEASTVIDQLQRLKPDELDALIGDLLQDDNPLRDDDPDLRAHVDAEASQDGA